MPIDDTYVCIDEELLGVERQQAEDEGRDLSEIEDQFERVIASVRDDALAHQDETRELLERVRVLPYRSDYAYEEPSDLTAIREARPDGPRQVDVDLDEDVLYDRMYGAWIGRCAGCLLGKPVEGWLSERLWGFLRATDNYPMREYIRSDMPDGVWEEYDWTDEPTNHTTFVDSIDHMARDDDIDYTVTGLALVSRHGIDFDSDNVAEFWLQNIPALNTYTAERVTYRNLLELLDPPETARYCNPYREGIGAQIRADFYGYVALGNPELAAELAWRDARISHVKNGIYGEMWVAAMLAAAPALNDREEVIHVGLSEIPANSRLTEAIEDVLAWHEEGIGYDDAVSRIHGCWDEDGRYGWLHTISNAQIVAVGLLYGDGDYEISIGHAVQAAFDTDCNGATVGSVIGAMHGASALPKKWTDPLNDAVQTSLVEYPLEDISDLARQTLDLHLKHC